MKDSKLSTKALHSGHDTNLTQGTRAVPLYQSTSYIFKDSNHAANLFALSEPGYIYTRLNNPTNDVLEKRLASIDNGIGAVLTAGGTAAISTAILTLLKSGDHIVASNSLYGGTYNMFNVMLPRLDIKTTFVDPSKPENFSKASKKNTRLFFVESLGNPKLDVLDLEKISVESKKNDVPFMVDNTVATPALLNPINHGANIVVYSLTKYINGNGTALGGAIIDGGNFDWSNGKFPEFTNPSPGYHGLVLHDALGPAAFIAKARIEGLRDIGAAISPFNSFQIIQGLETLEIRMKKHSENALKLAKWLDSRDEVSWVNYPGLKTSSYNALSKKYLPKGQSGLLTFGAIGGFNHAKKIADNTNIFSLVANIGDSKSLIIHPSSTTHSQLSESEQLETGVSQDLIRLSVGLEDIDDLKQDLINAFGKV